MIKKKTMPEKAKNLKKKTSASVAPKVKSGIKSKVKIGDVIGVGRGVYKHYGIYSGRGKVIHYSAKSSDFGGDMSVHESELEVFLNGSKNYFICEFPKEHGRPREKSTEVSILGSLFSGEMPEPLKFVREIYDLFKKINYKLYSPAETVKRARSRIGEDSYSLIFNNCEHFVIWCKTGVSESHQVNELIDFLGRSVSTVCDVR